MTQKLAPYALSLMRIVFGFLYLPHGLQKLVGWFDGTVHPLDSLRGVAGIIETVGGVLIALGLFTRPVAFIASGEMAAAYFISHAPRGPWPILNGGELSALYCFAFLYFALYGPGPLSLDVLMKRGKRK
ncbi:MAG: DoxX family protein [Acidimicrobiia bacterium]|nr:DoxX family protein [Acidimicrobiia bacterium]